MKVDLGIEADITPVLKAFRKNLKNNPAMQKKMLRGAINLGRSEARRNTYRRVHKGTGNLKKSFSTKLFKDNSGYIINRASYAGLLEHGGTVKAKNKKFLTFQTEDGRWIKTQSITIKAKMGFVREMERLYSSNAPLQKMEQILERELNKIYK